MMKIEWKCPKCGADANAHGKGGEAQCSDRGSSDCQGFLCECDGDTRDGHGDSFEAPCPNAVCYHCGYEGTFPAKPKGLQAWERKALDAGWTPPEPRRKDLGL